MADHFSPASGPDLLPRMYSMPIGVVPKPHSTKFHLVADHSAREFALNNYITKADSVKNTAQIVIQCSGRNTLCCNKITTCTNSNYVKVIMSLMKDKSSMKYSFQCSGRNTEAESETNS